MKKFKVILSIVVMLSLPIWACLLIPLSMVFPEYADFLFYFTAFVCLFRGLGAVLIAKTDDDLNPN